MSHQPLEQRVKGARADFISRRVTARSPGSEAHAVAQHQAHAVPLWTRSNWPSISAIQPTNWPPSPKAQIWDCPAASRRSRFHHQAIKCRNRGCEGDRTHTGAGNIRFNAVLTCVTTSTSMCCKWSKFYVRIVLLKLGGGGTLVCFCKAMRLSLPAWRKLKPASSAGQCNGRV